MILEVNGRVTGSTSTAGRLKAFRVSDFWLIRNGRAAGLRTCWWRGE